MPRDLAKFGIWATRSGGSVFGAAQAWTKGADGQPMTFDSLEKARAEADRLNGQTTSRNVYYSAKPMNEAGEDLAELWERDDADDYDDEREFDDDEDED